MQLVNVIINCMILFLGTFLCFPSFSSAANLTGLELWRRTVITPSIPSGDNSRCVIGILGHSSKGTHLESTETNLYLTASSLPIQFNASQPQRLFGVDTLTGQGLMKNQENWILDTIRSFPVELTSWKRTKTSDEYAVTVAEWFTTAETRTWTIIGYKVSGEATPDLAFNCTFGSLAIDEYRPSGPPNPQIADDRLIFQHLNNQILSFDMEQIVGTTLGASCPNPVWKHIPNSNISDRDFISNVIVNSSSDAVYFIHRRDYFGNNESKKYFLGTDTISFTYGNEIYRSPSYVSFASDSVASTGLLYSHPYLLFSGVCNGSGVLQHCLYGIDVEVILPPTEFSFVVATQPLPTNPNLISTQQDFFVHKAPGVKWVFLAYSVVDHVHAGSTVRVWMTYSLPVSSSSESIGKTKTKPTQLWKHSFNTNIFCKYHSSVFESSERNFGPHTVSDLNLNDLVFLVCSPVAAPSNITTLNLTDGTLGTSGQYLNFRMFPDDATSAITAMSIAAFPSNSITVISAPYHYQQGNDTIHNCEFAATSPCFLYNNSFCPPACKAKYNGYCGPEIASKDLCQSGLGQAAGYHWCENFQLCTFAKENPHCTCHGFSGSACRAVVTPRTEQCFYCTSLDFCVDQAQSRDCTCSVITNPKRCNEIKDDQCGYCNNLKLCQSTADNYPSCFCSVFPERECNVLSSTTADCHWCPTTGFCAANSTNPECSCYDVDNNECRLSHELISQKICHFCPTESHQQSSLNMCIPYSTYEQNNHQCTCAAFTNSSTNCARASHACTYCQNLNGVCSNLTENPNCLCSQYIPHHLWSSSSPSSSPLPSPPLIQGQCKWCENINRYVDVDDGDTQNQCNCLGFSSDTTCALYKTFPSAVPDSFRPSSSCHWCDRLFTCVDLNLDRHLDENNLCDCVNLNASACEHGPAADICELQKPILIGVDNAQQYCTRQLQCPSPLTCEGLNAIGANNDRRLELACEAAGCSFNGAACVNPGGCFQFFLPSFVSQPFVLLFPGLIKDIFVLIAVGAFRDVISKKVRRIKLKLSNSFSCFAPVLKCLVWFFCCGCCEEKSKKEKKNIHDRNIPTVFDKVVFIGDDYFLDNYRNRKEEEGSSWCGWCYFCVTCQCCCSSKQNNSNPDFTDYRYEFNFNRYTVMVMEALFDIDYETSFQRFAHVYQKEDLHDDNAINGSAVGDPVYSSATDVECDTTPGSRLRSDINAEVNNNINSTERAKNHQSEKEEHEKQEKREKQEGDFERQVQLEVRQLRLKLFDAVAFGLFSQGLFIDPERLLQNPNEHDQDDDEPMTTKHDQNNAVNNERDDEKYSNKNDTGQLGGAENDDEDDDDNTNNNSNNNNDSKAPTAFLKTKLSPITSFASRAHLREEVEEALFANADCSVYYAQSRDAWKRIAMSLNSFPSEPQLVFYCLGLCLLFFTALHHVLSNEATVQRIANNTCGIHHIPPNSSVNGTSSTSLSSTSAMTFGDVVFGDDAASATSSLGSSSLFWWSADSDNNNNHNTSNSTTSAPAPGHHTSGQIAGSVTTPAYFLLGFRLLNASSFSTAMLVLFVKLMRGIYHGWSANSFYELKTFQRIPLLSLYSNRRGWILLCIYAILVLPFALGGPLYGSSTQSAICLLPIGIGVVGLVLDGLILWLFRRYCALNPGDDDDIDDLVPSTGSLSPHKRGDGSPTTTELVAKLLPITEVNANLLEQNDTSSKQEQQQQSLLQNQKPSAEAEAPCSTPLLSRDQNQNRSAAATSPTAWCDQGGGGSTSHFNRQHPHHQVDVYSVTSSVRSSNQSNNRRHRHYQYFDTSSVRSSNQSGVGVGSRRVNNLPLAPYPSAESLALSFAQKEEQQADAVLETQAAAGDDKKFSIDSSAPSRFFSALCVFLLTEEVPTILLALSLQVSFNYMCYLSYADSFGVSGDDAFDVARIDFHARDVHCTWQIFREDVSGKLAVLSSALPFM